MQKDLLNKLKKLLAKRTATGMKEVWSDAMSHRGGCCWWKKIICMLHSKAARCNL